ncbi:hypothetical protein EYF80_039631 [Liparis tanakae]|uniref:Uncharacterized protein n=1 Tax=Liparis tanakae TaxID=230148 RepID=A0A4Z2GBY7_9TELE|nr:hypothetical protein EYF80_039631 [Liparis tanakae]
MAPMFQSTGTNIRHRLKAPSSSRGRVRFSCSPVVRAGEYDTLISSGMVRGVFQKIISQESNKEAPIRSRRHRAPLTSVKLLKTMVGMVQWYTAKMLSSGASNPPNLPDMAPKAVAVCLKEGGRKWKTFPHLDHRNIIHTAQKVVAEKYRMY